MNFIPHGGLNILGQFLQSSIFLHFYMFVLVDSTTIISVFIEYGIYGLTPFALAKILLIFSKFLSIFSKITLATIQ